MGALMGRRSKQKEKKLPKYLTERQILNLYDAIPHHERRDGALIALMAGAGLRVAELVALESDDVNLIDRLIHVENGKGHKDRTVTMSDKTHELCNRYLGGRRDGPAILSKVGSHALTTRQVRRVVRQYAIKSDPRLDWVHPHTLRHSYAVMLLVANVNIRAIQKLMGHSSIDQTMIYLDVVPKDIQDQMAQKTLPW